MQKLGATNVGVEHGYSIQAATMATNSHVVSIIRRTDQMCYDDEWFGGKCAGNIWAEGCEFVEQKNLA
jgi:hypothetical protein